MVFLHKIAWSVFCSPIFFEKVLKYMNKFILGIVFCFGSLAQSYASPNDSISTHYNNGEFITYSQVLVDVPKDIMNNVLDDFIFQSKYDLDELFKWALVGMKLRNEQDDIIVFNMKSTLYDKKTNVIKSINDVNVPNIINFPNIQLNSRMIKTLQEDGNTKLNIDVLYSDAFLKKTNGYFKIVPIDNKSCYVKLETRVQFGWFFNFFINQISYKYIMEWRFKKILDNVCKEAERRTKLISNAK